MALQVALPLPVARLHAAAAGDPRAYTELVLRVQNTLTAITLAIVRDGPASEDIAQEAFLRCWRERGQLRAAESILPWLRQVTRNLARDHLRSMAVRAPLHARVVDAEAVADEALSPDRALDAMHERALLRDAIDALPEDSRETLLLYFREGEDAEAVASLLGLSAVAVRKRISRVRQRLRADMLARLRNVAIVSAPAAGFGAAIGAALIGASAPAAAAVTFGVSSAAASSGKGQCRWCSRGCWQDSR